MNQKEIIKSLGEFYSYEKEELEGIRSSIATILEKSKVDEDLLNTLIACEKDLAVLRIKYTERLLRLYKAGYIVT